MTPDRADDPSGPDGADPAADWAATRAWVAAALSPGEHIEAVTRLRGGWTSRMRRLEIAGPDGRRALVLRSFVKPFYLRHADGLLRREADVLRLLEATAVPAAGLVAVDATARHCDHPSLLMTLLPGTVRTDDAGAADRAALLARQLADVHRLPVPAAARPRAYEAWTSAERVRPPADTRRPGLWERAVDVIRRDPPAHRSCFLHRDFHPGNVLFTGGGAGLRISGVVDWVETSWGPADLDVAHCSSALALLHGVPAGMCFADRYAAAGGALAEDRADHLYWRLLDALAFAPDAEKVAVPWRELGRTDLTPEVLTGRLEEYLEALFDRYG
ncbi:aminoglycoside phosphotransferase family protein [Streptomyces sp. NPDC006529]|uniref:phosphotransferase family protein n=1 Tax=Streptomyces sp. NPDC006529 TaxID=3157177 RepID=UPI0033A136FE